MATTAAKLKHRVDLVVGWALAAFMGAAVLNVLWQVFTRYVLKSPSAYTDELARYLLIWIGLFGGAYAAGKRMHLAVDLLPQKLTGRPRDALGVVIELLVALFAFFALIIGGLRLVSLTLLLEQTSAALRVPLGYVYLALPVSGILILFYSILFMSDHIRGLRGRPPLLVETDVSSAAAFATEAHLGTNVDPAALGPDPAR